MNHWREGSIISGLGEGIRMKHISSLRRIHLYGRHGEAVIGNIDPLTCDVA